MIRDVLAGRKPMIFLRGNLRTLGDRCSC